MIRPSDHTVLTLVKFWGRRRLVPGDDLVTESSHRCQALGARLLRALSKIDAKECYEHLVPNSEASNVAARGLRTRKSTRC